MLCLTGSEGTVGELRARFARFPDAGLHEARIDLLEEPYTSGTDLGLSPKRLLFTCRPQREGGAYVGDERERIELLVRAIRDLGPAWVDLESSSRAQDRERVARVARGSGTRLLISRHDHAGGATGRAEQLLAELESLGGDAVKLALVVDDAVELEPLLRAGERARRPAVVLGMGPAGLLSRALYPRFGSPWTYAAANAGEETAPGQLTADAFVDWRLPPPAERGLFALLGGPQVLESPGPRVYNRLFAAQGLEACYLPVITDRPREALELLVGLGLRGASVTMPLKERVVPLLGELGPGARAVGVVNTITVDPDVGLRGDLTDGDGAVAALERACGTMESRQVVVMGSGATAAAIAWALNAAGSQVTILGRDRKRAEDLGARLALRAGQLDDLAWTPFDVLVQATPVGADDPSDTLVGDSEMLAGKVVLDVVHAHETRLLAETRARGGRAISGRAMWAEQGRRQLARWLGIDLPAELLEVDP
jgi:3-dehydroquinate dehydratase/shikimate dehydrogenase